MSGYRHIEMNSMDKRLTFLSMLPPLFALCPSLAFFSYCIQVFFRWQLSAQHLSSAVFHVHLGDFFCSQQRALYLSFSLCADKQHIKVASGKGHKLTQSCKHSQAVVDDQASQSISVVKFSPVKLHQGQLMPIENITKWTSKRALPTAASTVNGNRNTTNPALS